MTKKKEIFKYFKDNPNVVWDNDNIKYSKLLGVKKNTYLGYKLEYRAMLQIKEVNMLKVKDPEMYFKGRSRQKFIFDDTELFK